MTEDGRLVALSGNRAWVVPNLGLQTHTLLLMQTNSVETNR